MYFYMRIYQNLARFLVQIIYDFHRVTLLLIVVTCGSNCECRANYGDARISPGTARIHAGNLSRSHIDKSSCSHICARVAPERRGLALRHFSSDLTLIVLTIHRHSHTAKVFELVLSPCFFFFFLWHLLRIFLSHPRPFFLSRSLCLGTFSELKKATCLTKDGKRKARDNRNQFIIPVQIVRIDNEGTALNIHMIT